MCPSSGQTVRRVEEEYRTARLRRDLNVLSRLYDNSMVDLDSFTNTADRDRLLMMAPRTYIDDLAVDVADVRISGDVAIVSGREARTDGLGATRTAFNRVWRRADGGWRWSRQAPCCRRASRH